MAAPFRHWRVWLCVCAMTFGPFVMAWSGVIWLELWISANEGADADALGIPPFVEDVILVLKEPLVILALVGGIALGLMGWATGVWLSSVPGRLRFRVRVLGIVQLAGLLILAGVIYGLFAALPIPRLADFLGGLVSDWAIFMLAPAFMRAVNKVDRSMIAPRPPGLLCLQLAFGMAFLSLLFDMVMRLLAQHIPELIHLLFGASPPMMVTAVNWIEVAPFLSMVYLWPVWMELIRRLGTAQSQVATVFD